MHKLKIPFSRGVLYGMESPPLSVEKVFHAEADIKEGVSGRKEIHTQYPNDLPLRKVKSRSSEGEDDYG